MGLIKFPLNLFSLEIFNLLIQVHCRLQKNVLHLKANYDFDKETFFFFGIRYKKHNK